MLRILQTNDLFSTFTFLYDTFSQRFAILIHKSDSHNESCPKCKMLMSNKKNIRIVNVVTWIQNRCEVIFFIVQNCLHNPGLTIKKTSLSKLRKTLFNTQQSSSSGFLARIKENRYDFVPGDVSEYVSEWYEFLFLVWWDVRNYGLTGCLKWSYFVHEQRKKSSGFKFAVWQRIKFFLVLFEGGGG